MISQAGQHNLPQAEHLVLSRWSHLWIHKRSHLRTHCVHCRLEVKGEFFRCCCCVLFWLSDFKIGHYSRESWCTCVGKLSSQPPDLHHGFISQAVVLTKLWGATGKFTSAHSSCSRSRRDKNRKFKRAKEKFRIKNLKVQHFLYIYF